MEFVPDCALSGTANELFREPHEFCRKTRLRQLPYQVERSRWVPFRNADVLPSQNLYLRLVPVRIRQREEQQGSLEPGLWHGLPESLLLKVLCEHLPVDHLWKLLEESSSLWKARFTNYFLAHQKCVLVSSDPSSKAVVVHNFDASYQWKRLQIPERVFRAKLKTLSDQGVAVLSCSSQDGLDTFVAYVDLMSSSAKACVVEYPQGGCKVRRAQVVHRGDRFDLVFILRSQGNELCAIFHPWDSSWTFPEKLCQRSLASVMGSLWAGRRAAGMLVFPEGFYCSQPFVCSLGSRDIFFSVASSRSGEGAVFFAAENDRYGEWHLMPGPDLRDLEVTEILYVVFDPESQLCVLEDSGSNLLACSVDPWCWHVPKCIRKSFSLHGKYFQTIFIP